MPPEHKKLFSDLRIATNILRIAKKKHSIIFLKGVTSYIIKMCPEDIKRTLQEEESIG